MHPSAERDIKRGKNNNGSYLQHVRLQPPTDNEKLEEVQGHDEPDRGNVIVVLCNPSNPCFFSQSRSGALKSLWLTVKLSSPKRPVRLLHRPDCCRTEDPGKLAMESRVVEMQRHKPCQMPRIPYQIEIDLVDDHSATLVRTSSIGRHCWNQNTPISCLC
jgi:hypothetical protein